MTVTCPSGHESATSDYCDTCGAPIGGGPPSSATVAEALMPSLAPDREACPYCAIPRAGRFCEECGYDFVARTGGGPVAAPAEAPPVEGPPVEASPVETAAPNGAPVAEPVGAPAESAGFLGTGEDAGETALDGSVAAPDVPGGWIAVVAADRDFFEKVTADPSVVFPPFCPERTFAVSGEQVTIGRRSSSHVPEVDLSGPPVDPGISHLHAVLMARPEGGWNLVDPGSTNGTMLNDDLEPVEVNVPVPLDAGDRIHLGAWTTITLERG